VFILDFHSTFNPADYASEGGSGATQSQVWDPAAPGSTEGSGELFTCHINVSQQGPRCTSRCHVSLGAWRGTLEDWASEDCEDLSVSPGGGGGGGGGRVHRCSF